MGGNVLAPVMLTNTLSLVLFSFRRCVYEFCALPVLHLGSIRPDAIINIKAGGHGFICIHSQT